MTGLVVGEGEVPARVEVGRASMRPQRPYLAWMPVARPQWEQVGSDAALLCAHPRVGFHCILRCLL